MDNDMLRAEFAKAVEDFDRDRVYPSDIKKLFNWYNLLISEGYTKFSDATAEAPVEEEASTEE